MVLQATVPRVQAIVAAVVKLAESTRAGAAWRYHDATRGVTSDVRWAVSAVINGAGSRRARWMQAAGRGLGDTDEWVRTVCAVMVAAKAAAVSGELGDAIERKVEFLTEDQFWYPWHYRRAWHSPIRFGRVLCKLPVVVRLEQRAGFVPGTIDTINK